MKFVTHYRDAAEMCAGGGNEWLASLVDTAGLPLEVIHILHDRVLHIDALDYEEGREEPMTRHSRWWWDVLGRAPGPPGSVENAIIAVYPDGSHHVVAGN
jgi:hypothetical protein